MPLSHCMLEIYLECLLIINVLIDIDLKASILWKTNGENHLASWAEMFENMVKNMDKAKHCVQSLWIQR